MPAEISCLVVERCEGPEIGSHWAGARAHEETRLRIIDSDLACLGLGSIGLADDQLNPCSAYSRIARG